MSSEPKTYSDLDSALSAALADLHEQSGLSLRAAAAKAGMSHNRLGKILRGKTPPPVVGEIDRIATTYGSTASAVFATAEVALNTDELARRRKEREANRAAKEAEVSRRLAAPELKAASEGEDVPESVE